MLDIYFSLIIIKFKMIIFKHKLTKYKLFILKNTLNKYAFIFLYNVKIITVKYKLIILFKNDYLMVLL